MKTQEHSIYVVRLCDGRIKVGSTSNVKKRMAYYRQEARRNNRDSLVWYAPKPFPCKEQALHAERAMRLYFLNESKKHQREWLTNGVDFSVVINAADELRCLIGNESDEEKADFPWLGVVGNFMGLTA